MQPDLDMQPDRDMELDHDEEVASEESDQYGRMKKRYSEDKEYRLTRAGTLIDFKIYIKVDSVFNLRQNFMYPPFYNKLKNYIQQSENGSLSEAIKDEENYCISFNNLIEPFINEFELPHELFNEILQYYCTTKDGFEIRRIRIEEYSEMSGLILDAMIDTFKNERRPIQSYIEIHKKFVILFTNWPAMIEYAKVMEEMEDDEVFIFFTTGVINAYKSEVIE